MGDRIGSVHVCDWLVATPDTVFDHGMPGDRVIDVPGLRRLAEEAGYDGLREIESLSGRWRAMEADLVLRTCLERHERFC